MFKKFKERQKSKAEVILIQEISVVKESMLVLQKKSLQAEWKDLFLTL